MLNTKAIKMKKAMNEKVIQIIVAMSMYRRLRYVRLSMKQKQEYLNPIIERHNNFQQYCH